jgi:hypothetical protein
LVAYGQATLADKMQRFAVELMILAGAGHRRVLESPLDSEPAANFAFASPLVSVPL